MTRNFGCQRSDSIKDVTVLRYLPTVLLSNQLLVCKVKFYKRLFLKIGIVANTIYFGFSLYTAVNNMLLV